MGLSSKVFGIVRRGVWYCQKACLGLSGGLFGIVRRGVWDCQAGCLGLSVGLFGIVRRVVWDCQADFMGFSFGVFGIVIQGHGDHIMVSSILLSHLLQCTPHVGDVQFWLVVEEAVGKDELDVLLALSSRPVVLGGQPLPDRPKVHGLLDDCVVVWQVQLDCVHRLLEGPCEFVRPDIGHDPSLDEQELVCHPSWSAWRRDGGGLDLTPDHPGR